MSIEIGEALDLARGKRDDLRRIERQDGETWTLVRMYELKKGDIFRMFDDVPDPTETGRPYRAMADPVVKSLAENIWSIDGVPL